MSFGSDGKHQKWKGFILKMKSKVYTSSVRSCRIDENGARMSYSYQVLKWMWLNGYVGLLWKMGRKVQNSREMLRLKPVSITT